MPGASSTSPDSGGLNDPTALALAHNDKNPIVADDHDAQMPVSTCPYPDSQLMLQLQQAKMFPLENALCCRCAKDEFNPKAQLFLTPLVQAMRLMIHLGETVPEGADELAYHISAGEPLPGGTLDRHVRKRLAKEPAMLQYTMILTAKEIFQAGGIRWERGFKCLLRRAQRL